MFLPEKNALENGFCDFFFSDSFDCLASLCHFMNYTRMLVPSMVQHGIVLQNIVVLLHRDLVVAVEG